MEINRVEGYRKFCNKVWNATKFCLFRLELVDLDGVRKESTFVPNKSELPTGEESIAERWLLHKLNIAALAVDESLEARDFAAASTAAHQFFLTDFCDVFIVSHTRDQLMYRKRLNRFSKRTLNRQPRRLLKIPSIRHWKRV